MPRRSKRQPIPVFLPGKSHGQRILEGYSPQSCTESKTTANKQTKTTTDLLKGNLFRENLPAVWLAERMLHFKWIFFAQVSFLSGVQAATDQNSAMQPASKKDLFVCFFWCVQYIHNQHRKILSWCPLRSPGIVGGSGFREQASPGLARRTKRATGARLGTWTRRRR